MTFHIGIVVGETSGDNLAADLILSLKDLYPTLIFEGILGPQLIKAGGIALYNMERLSVMGFTEPLKRLPELIHIHKKITKHFIENPPDLFIGVDSPDFTLKLEETLKNRGIPTVHYVSPSVWAWRRGRVKLIKKAVDLMLTLFPFEAKFYEQHKVPVCFVGHPLADRIPLELDREIIKEARGKFGLETNKPVVVILPGSRNNELKYLAEIYLKTAQFCYEKRPDLQFIAAVVSEEHKNRILNLQKILDLNIPLKVVVGETSLAITSADIALVTSGTATLEVMLYKKPMVVAYRMHPLTYQIARFLVKISYIALPNLLANEGLVPEYIQNKATPELLGNALLHYLPPFDVSQLVKQFNKLHLILKQNGSVVAARAIQTLLVSRSAKNQD